MANQRINFNKLLLEGMAIIASILIAFAIDSSWDDFQENKKREYALNALRSDISDTSRGLVFHQGFHEKKVSNMLRLLEITNRPTNEMNVEEFVGLGREAIYFSTYLPPTGAIDSLIGSGDLNNLLDAQLRSDLVAYQKDLESLYRTQRWGLAFVNEDLTSFLRNKVPLVIFGFIDQDLRDDFDLFYTDDQIAVYAHELAGSLEFQNLIHTRLLIADLLEVKVRNLAEQIKEICARLTIECSDN